MTNNPQGGETEYLDIPEPAGAHGGDPDGCAWCKWFQSPRILKPQKSFPQGGETAAEQLKETKAFVKKVLASVIAMPPRHGMKPGAQMDAAWLYKFSAVIDLCESLTSRLAAANERANENAARWKQCADDLVESAAKLDSAVERADKAEEAAKKMENDCDQVAAERDAFEEQIGNMVSSCGLECEWSSCHAHEDCVGEAFAVVEARAESAESALAQEAEKRGAAEDERTQIMGLIQRFQPGGSPPAFSNVGFVDWILQSLRDGYEAAHGICPRAQSAESALTVLGCRLGAEGWEKECDCNECVSCYEDGSEPDGHDNCDCNQPHCNCCACHGTGWLPIMVK